MTRKSASYNLAPGPVVGVFYCLMPTVHIPRTGLHRGIIFNHRLLATAMPEDKSDMDPPQESELMKGIYRLTNKKTRLVLDLNGGATRLLRTPGIVLTFFTVQESLRAAPNAGGAPTRRMRGSPTRFGVFVEMVPTGHTLFKTSEVLPFWILLAGKFRSAAYLCHKPLIPSVEAKMMAVLSEPIAANLTLTGEPMLSGTSKQMLRVTTRKSLPCISRTDCRCESVSYLSIQYPVPSYGYLPRASSGRGVGLFSLRKACISNNKARCIERGKGLYLYARCLMLAARDNSGR